METIIVFDNVLKLQIGYNIDEVVNALKKVVKDNVIINNTQDNIIFKNHNTFNGFVANIIPLLQKALTKEPIWRYKNGENENYCPTFWIYPLETPSVGDEIHVSMGDEIPHSNFSNNKLWKRDAIMMGARQIVIKYNECVDADNDDGYIMKEKVVLSVENINKWKTDVRKRYDEVHLLNEDYYGEDT